MLKFDAKALPVGTEFMLGERRWRLNSRASHDSKLMLFAEVNHPICLNPPSRVMEECEIQALYEMGVVFVVPFHSGQRGAEPDRPHTQRIMTVLRDLIKDHKTGAGIALESRHYTATTHDVREFLREQGDPQ